MSSIKNIYFDHSATTPMDKRVVKAMMPYFSDNFGNASSLHSFGQEALRAVDEARGQVSKFLNSLPDEIVFTSGATEADNLAIRGLVGALKKKGLEKIHIITSKIEHDAVLEPCNNLKKDGVEITFVNVKSNGIVDLEEIQAAIRPNTCLVSIMYVNSEVGAIQPIREIGKIVRKTNERRIKDWKNNNSHEKTEKPMPIYFHTDATQAVNFLNCDVEYNYIDMLSMSAHKIYGPKGIGALYVRKGVPMEALQLGGHHERNMRSGTLNVPGIVGFGTAISLLSTEAQTKQNKKIASLRDRLVRGLENSISKIVLNTDRNNAVVSHAHFSFLGVEGESMLLSLDFEGIAVSTGSACAAGSLKPSHVLMAMGIKQEVCHNSIRFTLGKGNNKKDVDKIIEVMPAIVERLRNMSPEKNF